jgi:hypothetical protein
MSRHRGSMALADWFERCGGLTPIQGNLHRSPIPITSEHFRTLKQAGIRVIYSMEEAVPGDLAKAQGFDWRPHFWVDDKPPTYEQMDAFLESYLAVPEDVPTLVHCKAGWGRAGSAITCALISKNDWSAEIALRYYWRRVPDAQSIMTWNGQAEFVRGYAAALQGRGLR